MESDINLRNSEIGGFYKYTLVPEPHLFGSDVRGILRLRHVIIGLSEISAKHTMQRRHQTGVDLFGFPFLFQRTWKNDEEFMERGHQDGIRN